MSAARITLPYFSGAGAGVSKSAASRHFVALSAARMKEWMGADLSALDIMVVQIDGIYIGLDPLSWRGEVLGSGYLV
jgi:hypothetical protein